MNLRLRVFKTDYMGDYNQWRHIRFAVVDLDRSEHYPANYVCLLPANPRANGKVHNNFSRLFGNDSPELAKTLLTKASKTERDWEIKAEIERRLALLEPKPPAQVKCRVCGKCFESHKRGRSKQRICQECKQKMYASQT
jgi:hypothetical protein